MTDEKLQRANLLMEQGRFDLALETYRQVLADSPEHAVAHAAFGWCLSQCGQPDEGEGHISQAIRLSPGSDYIHKIHAMYLAVSRPTY